MLPDFDKRKQQVDEKNKENGVLLPGLEEPARLPDQAYILIQKKLYKNWPDEEKKDLTLIWEKIRLTSSAKEMAKVLCRSNHISLHSGRNPF